MKTSDVMRATATVLNQLYRSDPDLAALSSLRQASDFMSPAAKKLWPMLLSALPDDGFGTRDQPSSAERAMLTSLRLYATLQQGQSYNVFHGYKDGGISFMKALAQARVVNMSGFDSRIVHVLNAPTYANVEHGLLVMARLLKSSKSYLEIDFVKLAGELYSWQYSRDAADTVSLWWGRDYYRLTAKSNDDVAETVNQ